LDQTNESRFLGLSSIALTIFGVAAPYRWHEIPEIYPDIALLLAAILAIWAVWLALPKTWKEGRSKLNIVGPWILIVSAPLLGIAWIYLQSSAPNERVTQAAVAKLAELGWTVKPGPNSVQFEITSGPLPPMKESATYFERLAKPFNLHLQQVSGLEGLHYLANIPGCTKIEIGAGEFTDISELSGFSHLTKLVIGQLPLNGTGTVDLSPLAVSPSVRPIVPLFGISMQKGQSAVYPKQRFRGSSYGTPKRFSPV
jgi:hypothetical protein